MPKLKTRKAAAKRFKATGTGKFLRRRAFLNHLLDHKSPKRKRHLGTMALVDERDAPLRLTASSFDSDFYLSLILSHVTRQKGQCCPQTP